MLLTTAAPNLIFAFGLQVLVVLGACLISVLVWGILGSGSGTKTKPKK